MNKKELEQSYFDWMCKLVCDERYANNNRLKYRKLFSYLHNTDYNYFNQLPNDQNRALDGMNMRYYFGFENQIDYAIIAETLDTRPASMLETLLSLACKCEDVMADSEKGDRVSLWFWNMLYSLGLSKMNDEAFDKEEADYILNRFFMNEYEPNGVGGLFTIEGIDIDLRKEEIWDQMCLYLDYLVYGGTQ